jgi:hypothetical protein
MSTNTFNSTPRRVVKKDGKFMLEIIENYTPSNRKIPREVIEKMDKEPAERIEEVRNKLLKSK